MGQFSNQVEFGLVTGGRKLSDGATAIASRLARPFPMNGEVAVAKVARLRDRMSTILRRGFDTHVARVGNRRAGVAQEDTTRNRNGPTYRHEEHPAYQALPARFST